MMISSAWIRALWKRASDLHRKAGRGTTTPKEAQITISRIINKTKMEVGLI